MHSHFITENAKCAKWRKLKKLFWNFASSYLGIDWHNLLPIWYVDLPSSGASQQQIWLNLDKNLRATAVWKLHSLSSCQYTHGVAPLLSLGCITQYHVSSVIQGPYFGFSTLVRCPMIDTYGVTDSKVWLISSHCTHFVNFYLQKLNQNNSQ